MAMMGQGSGKRKNIQDWVEHKLPDVLLPYKSYFPYSSEIVSGRCQGLGHDYFCFYMKHKLVIRFGLTSKYPIEVVEKIMKVCITCVATAKPMELMFW